MSDIHYYSNYANTRDIDCFFRIGNVAYHFASNGQPIPPFITRNTNIEIQTAVYALQTRSTGDVDVNVDFVNGLIQNEIALYDSVQVPHEEFSVEQMIINYVESFQEMARVGFVSMDLDEEGVFHIIASPTIQKLPQGLFEKLPEVREDQVRIG
jgi:hypothetical protein